MSDKVKQILYYSPTIWSNTDFYRTTGVLPFINHPDLTLRDISHYGQITQWDLKKADAIIVQRPGSLNGLGIIKLAKQCGLKIICDYDDDVLNVDNLNPTYNQYQQQRDIILQCIELADEVWCSTEGVRSSLGKGIVIKNALNDHLLDKIAPANTKSKNIVWRGGQSHQADMYENADNIIEMINGHPDFHFYFIGDRFTYLEQRCGDNYTSIDGMGIMRYFDYLRRLKPRAMIFPLCDTLLNRSKSNISWLEASWAGAEYFGNKRLPEFDLPSVHSLSEFPNGNSHKQAVKYIEDNLLLSRINLLRQESLLTL